MPVDDVETFSVKTYIRAAAVGSNCSDNSSGYLSFCSGERAKHVGVSGVQAYAVSVASYPKILVGVCK